ncbi:unnamed protein product [Haemonchus placei]|uniref:Transposase n=1 Tax=Haemonchus placei TaxID=6290 RepID=A0A0N4W832_HAEPC|nr:unnamed protein product [Haemonchus placei]
MATNTARSAAAMRYFGKKAALKVASIAALELCPEGNEY